MESPCIKMERQLFGVTSHLDGSVSDVRLEILEIEVRDSFPEYNIDGFLNGETLNSVFCVYHCYFVCRR
jgi:hypothetical protein